MSNITSIKVKETISRATKVVVVKYRRMMLEELSKALDEIRLRAVSKFIIPNAHLPERNPYKLRKLQPSTAGKLTERTGALNIMMREGVGIWKKTGTKTWRSDSPAVIGIAKVEGKVGINESFKGVLSVNTINASAVASRLTGKTKAPTAQQLALRFKWENGIRGEKRPFVSPAAKEQEFKMNAIIKQKIAELGAMIK